MKAAILVLLIVGGKRYLKKPQKLTRNNLNS
jgi:hypothetical protein